MPVDVVTRRPPTSVTFPFPALEPASDAAKRELESEALRVNRRYLDEFLEQYAFCPYSRSGRKNGSVHQYVHYCDSHDPAPLVELMAAVAKDAQQVVVQLILPAIDVAARDWIAFCHELTAYGHATMGDRSVLACAPLHPDLPYTTTSPEAMIPLFRRTPDPTLQWVRLDGLSAIYEGRGSDAVFVDPRDIEDYLKSASTRPNLYDRIAQTNAAMAKRLSFQTVERLLADIADDARKSYARIFLSTELGSAPVAASAFGNPSDAPVQPARAKVFQAAAAGDRKVRVATFSELEDRRPAGAVVAGVDLVVIRHDDHVSVLEGRCPHRAALLAQGRVEGDHLICQEHGWDFHIDSGRSACIPGEGLCSFTAHIDVDHDAVIIDERDLDAWKAAHPAAFHRGELDDD